jgi:type II secretory pathway pseudopilin PulG
MWAGRKSCPSGITLLESLLAAIVLALAVTALVMPFTAGAQSVAEEARMTLAVNLAQDLMEEILSKAFRDPDGTSFGETGRSAWDDMSDYDGFSEQEGCIVGSDGATIEGAAAVGLTRHASVQSVYVAGQDTAKPPTFCRVSVNVRYHGHTIMQISRLAYANE